MNKFIKHKRSVALSLCKDTILANMWGMLLVVGESALKTSSGHNAWANRNLGLWKALHVELSLAKNPDVAILCRDVSNLTHPISVLDRARRRMTIDAYEVAVRELVVTKAKTLPKSHPIYLILKEIQPGPVDPTLSSI